MIYYYFDENMSEPLANAINELAAVSRKYEVSTVAKLMGGIGATDNAIVDKLISLNQKSVILSQDSDFLKREIYPLIMKSKNLGLLQIKFLKGSKSWSQYLYILNCWEDIRTLSPFPFAYVLLNKKLSKIS